MCWVCVSAGAKMPWTTVTVVTDHGTLQNTVESTKMQFAAIRIRILSGLCNSHVHFNVPSFRFFVRNFRFFWFCRSRAGRARFQLGAGPVGRAGCHRQYLREGLRPEGVIPHPARGGAGRGDGNGDCAWSA